MREGQLNRMQMQLAALADIILIDLFINSRAKPPVYLLLNHVDLSTNAAFILVAIQRLFSSAVTDNDDG